MARHASASRIGWQLPPFFCPIPSPRHPKLPELEKSAVAWIDTFGLYRDATERAWGLATHSTDLSCRVIPYGNEEPLLLFIEWNHWAFAVDDWQDSGSAQTRASTIVDYNARLVRALETPGVSLLPPGPFTNALDDLVIRTRQMAGPMHLRRICEGLRDWLFGAAWQAGNEERDVMPTLNEYVAMRPSVNGTRFTMAFSQLANGLQVSEEEMYSDAVQALTDVAGFVVSCDNDLFSYAKEEGREVEEANLINVLAHMRGCSPHEALGEAVAIRDRSMSLFLRLRDRVATQASPELHRYLESLGHYIVGCIRWMNEAPRFASPRNRHPLPVPGASYHVAFSDTPSDPSIAPLPVPAAMWWWEQERR